MFLSARVRSGPTVATRTTVSPLVVVAALAVLALASATAARVELGDCSPAHWEHLSLLFPRFHIWPHHTGDRFLQLPFFVRRLVWSQARLTAL